MLSRRNLGRLLCGLVPLLLFWIVLSGPISVQLSQNLAVYSAIAFVLVAVLFYLCFRLPAEWGVLAGLSLAMVLFATVVSYKWTTGTSDGAMIAGLVPYKDAKDYYMGADRILSGLPLDREARAVRRPLFPGFIASLELLDGQNLKLTLGLLAALAALSLYLSARQIRVTSGPAGAGLYSALMYFYIQPLVGYAMSELAGFIIGCLALSILWLSARRRSWPGFGLGLVTLMLAVSSRSGAFLVFPLIVVWAGWVFREGARFSWRATAVTAAVVAATYLVMNNLYAALLRVPAGANFQAFAYAMYGQVHGGTGWHSAIDDLHTTQTDVVASATLRFFLAHPFSFLIATAKSYVQLLLPGPQTIFAFGSGPEPAWLTYAFWAATMALIIWGLVRSIRQYREGLPGLVLAGALGTLISVPFLPPIDAGARFYVSTVGFLFVLPAIALGGFRAASLKADPSGIAPGGEARFLAAEALALLLLIVLVPLCVNWFSRLPAATVPVCPANQRAFAFRAAPAAYVDVLAEAGNRCGFVPEICLADFDQYGTEKSSDDFYQALLSLAGSSPSGLRLNIAINLFDAKSYYFVDLAAPASLAPQRNQVISGCALEQTTRNQTILQIVSSNAGSGN
jgi:hypothetical protein